jgi:hypothetical protein
MMFVVKIKFLAPPSESIQLGGDEWRSSKLLELPLFEPRLCRQDVPGPGISPDQSAKVMSDTIAADKATAKSIADALATAKVCSPQDASESYASRVSASNAAADGKTTADHAASITADATTTLFHFIRFNDYQQRI